MPKILPGWYVIEQFYPDGSAQFGVSQFTQTPQPPDNQTVYGTWPTRDAAEKAINDGSFRLAPHVYRGGNVSGSGGQGGPGGLNIPGIQAPGVPTTGPFSWVGAVAHWLGKFVLDLTDVHMWISLGWIVLGILLIIGGAYILIVLNGPAAKIGKAVTSATGKA